jgi:hypothetical protein
MSKNKIKLFLIFKSSFSSKQKQKTPMQSPEKDIKLDIICRCCLTEEGSMKNMQKETFESGKKHKVRLLDGFAKCSGVNLFTELDESTKNICQSCENKLRSSYDFRELCQTSDEVLRKKLDFIVDVKEEFDSENEENEKNIVYEDNQPYKFSQVFVAQKDKVKLLDLKTEAPKDDEEVMDYSDGIVAEPDDSSADEGEEVTPRRKVSKINAETTKTQAPQLDCKGCNFKFCKFVFQHSHPAIYLYPPFSSDRFQSQAAHQAKETLARSLSLSKLWAGLQTIFPASRTL